MKRFNVCAALFYFLAFVTPCVIVGVTFFILSMYPFGDKVLSVWDLQITYTYFYEWFRDFLAGNQSLFYSFSKSLGGNMYIGWAALLTSPVNLLIAFCGDNPMDFVTMMIVVKFGLAGLTSYFYVRRRFDLSRGISLCLSICYSMMLFMTTQSANPMWMDVVILLPLVMYGIYSVVNRGKVIFLYVSLLLCIICNYYNGYMVCLFCILFYLFESYLAVPKAERVRCRFMVNPGRFSVAFTLAVFSSVFILLPTIIGLLTGKGAVPSGLFTFEFRYELPDVVRSLFLGVYEKELLPQLYCGTLVLICSLWFFLHNKIEKREKVAAGLLLGFMVFSTWFAPLDRIWLGLRDGNSFYCRFAFLVSACMLFVAARALSKADEKSYRNFFKASLIIGLIAVVIFCDGNFPRIRYFVATAVLCVVLPALLYGLYRLKGNRLAQAVLTGVVVLCVCAEALFSCYGVLAFRLQSDNPSTYSRYQSYYDEGRKVLDELDEKDGTDVDAYRVEKTYNFLSPFRTIALNETMAFGYAGVALYDSTYDDRVQNALVRLGYTPDRGIRTSYNDPMIVSDSLLGITYVADTRCPPGFVESGFGQTWEGKKLYRNPYALPLGFGADRKVLEDVDFTGNPFEYQADFLSSLVGSDVGCIVEAETRLVEKNDEFWTWEVIVPDQAPKDACWYGFFEYPYQLSVDLYDGENYLYPYLDDWSQGMFPITSNVQDGTYRITLKGAIPPNADDLVFHASYVDMKAFESVDRQLASRPFNITSFKGGYVSGTYESTGDDILFTTIPFDSGWTIWVNGEIVEPHLTQNAFISLDVPEGVSTIEMTYVPRGFIAGVVVSALSIVAFVLYALRVYRRKDASQSKI